jgi:hypothetical protein
VNDPSLKVGKFLKERVGQKIKQDELRRQAEILFSRPAFYDLDEGDWSYGLWATVRTRLVWEQDLAPYLKSPNLKKALVTETLLRLERVMCEIAGFDHASLPKLRELCT